MRVHDRRAARDEPVQCGALHQPRRERVGRDPPDQPADRRTAADPFPARLVEGAALDRFVAGRAPIVDANAKPSPPMPAEVFP